MKLRLSLLVIIALLMITLGSVHTPTQASGFSIYYSFVPGTCNNFSFSLTAIRTYSFDVVPPSYHRVDTVGGNTVFDTPGTVTYTGNGTKTSPFTSLTAFYNQPQPYVYTSTFDWSYNGVIFYHNILSISCDINGIATGTAINESVSPPTPTPQGTATTTAGSGGVPGPGIPAGFVLHTIVCDTPVFNTPAGTAVGDNKIISGQTWFVNPTPVNGSDGQQWTEFFDGGYHNGYIPTRCVQ